MEIIRMTEEQVALFQSRLVSYERSHATVEKYMRDVGAFFAWLPEGKEISKATVIAYKRHLNTRYATASVNSILAAINQFLRMIHCEDCTVKSLKTQRRIFCAPEQELSKEEYLRLLAASKGWKRRRLNHIMQTICASGIRVSELEHITVEAVRRHRADVTCKNKVRTVFLPTELCQLLLRYVRDECITSGPVFITRGGRPVNRSNIWTEMQRLCVAADVSPSKVFPHNLRHLFACTYYALEKDIIRLADILGHSSIETTRIYTISTGAEHERQIAALGLVR